MTKKKDTVMDEAKRLGDEVMEFGRNTYLFGLGAVATAEEEMRGMFDRMVNKGRKVDDDHESLIGKAKEKAKDLGKTVEDRVEDTMASTLNRAGVPSRKEIRTLIARVEELTQKVDALAAR